MIKNCKKHGETEYAPEKDRSGRCKKCRSEAVIKRRRLVKQKLVAHFGGKCTSCGYNKCIGALVFHHHEDNKEFGISGNGSTKSFAKALKEAEKCTLLCHNCHTEIHCN